ncbi:hypothetical protein F511_28273 [Dorcoceras hygrometricum]|uniref:Uncharacterized protein n=1 Tax=Dorcoceras hygrometricum TaxID=472368 RepID=A0A2Z7BD48_9LAMI|nr:hypothetical protein F511_28273 [Dorcoceras hygrometricum]
MLNTLSSVSVRESRIQYLCDPQWFRDTASRGSTTIVAPGSQFRTCPSDHDSIGYPRMSASGESSTTMHRLLHASGSHPIPTPYDPNTTKTSDLSTRQMVTTWKVRRRSRMYSKRCRLDKVKTTTVANQSLDFTRRNPDASYSDPVASMSSPAGQPVASTSIPPVDVSVASYSVPSHRLQCFAYPVDRKSRRRKSRRSEELNTRR